MIRKCQVVLIYQVKRKMIISKYIFSEALINDPFTDMIKLNI